MYVLRGIITVFYLKLIFFFNKMSMDISYGWILRKSANFTVSPDIGATSSMTSGIIFV